MLLLWLSFDCRESDLSTPLLLIMGGSSAEEEEVVKIDADEDLVWDVRCEDIRATWLRARKVASWAYAIRARRKRVDMARVVVMAAKMVRGREKRMRAGVRVINIISVNIVAVDLRGVGWIGEKFIYILYFHCVVVTIFFLQRVFCM